MGCDPRPSALVVKVVTPPNGVLVLNGELLSLKTIVPWAPRSVTPLVRTVAVNVMGLPAAEGFTDVARLVVVAAGDGGAMGM